MPGALDNEARSADQAMQWMTSYGEPAEELTAVAALIRWTQRHDPAGAETLCHRALFDADMGVLGLAPERYREYVRDVRAEYVGSGAMPGHVFDLGRRAFLDSLLQSLESAPFFFALGPEFEANVRANVAAERAAPHEQEA